jgi:tetratricopeptide (TPR) repeat protein
MSQWRELMAEAEAARQALLRDRAAGEREFDRLLAAHPKDGMIYFKRGEAFEALGEVERAVDDYRRAETLFPMADWKTRARESASRLEA